MKNSIIITYRESSEERRNNLKSVLKYLSVLLNNDTELIIVEQDTNSKINWLSDINNYKYINHIFVKNEGVFNKGWGCNIGVNESNGEYLMVHDSDMFLRLNSYSTSFNLLNSFDVVDPYKNIYYLNKDNSDKFTSNYSININDRSTYTENIISGVITGGIFLIKKSKFLELKGFDETCCGWGHEDDVFDTKIKKLNLSIKYLDDSAIHIYHETNNGITNDDYYIYKAKNEKIFTEYKNMSTIELVKKLDSVSFFGDRNININDEESLLKRKLTETIYNEIILNINNNNIIDEVIKESIDKYKEIFFKTLSIRIRKELNDNLFTNSKKNDIINKTKRNK